MAAGKRLALGLCALSAVIALANGFPGPRGAAAAPACSGSKIVGKGSTLQGIAQQSVWGPGISSACGIPGLVSFNAAGSSAGLNAWNFFGTTSTDTSVAFVASDEAPTATQIAAAGTSAGGARPLVIPVAQTAIAVVINPPTGCEVDRITNKQLENVFKGNVKFWGKFDSASGETCMTAPVTRIVRPVGSGTTYQFKNYIFGANTAKLSCTESPGKSWKDLEPIGAEEKPNTVWPVDGVGGCKANELSAIKTSSETAGLGTGGAGLVKKVNITEGSIGYAALPDIEANRGISGEFANPNGDTHWLRLQNNGLVKYVNSQFASPLEASNNSANCYSARYTVPVGGRKAESGERIDWSQVFGADLNISKDSGNSEAYPLCTLTYDMAFNGYSKKAGFTEGQVTTAKDYLTEYVTASTGQTAIENAEAWYTPLPTGGWIENDVLLAARLAASRISFPFALPPPSLNSTSPPSPGSVLKLSITGYAETGSTVKIYTSSTCGGAPVATGSAASLGSSGIAVTVGESSTTTFYATATIGEETSACSTSSITYVKGPASPPSLVWTDPESPGAKISIHVGGSRKPETATVDLYKGEGCGGSPVVSGTADEFAHPGLAVTVSKNSTNLYSAKATDVEGHVSACSSPLTYVEDSSHIIFEAQHLADFEKIEECTSSRTTESGDPLGSGRPVLKFTVDDTDVNGDPSCTHEPPPPIGSPDPRAQAVSPATLEPGKEFWLRIKFLIPNSYPELPESGGFLSVAGIFGPPFGGPLKTGGPWHIEIQHNTIFWERNKTYGEGSTPWEAPLEKGKWIEIMIHELFAKAGWIEMWVNGEQITLFAPGSSQDPSGKEKPTKKLEMETRDSSNEGGNNSYRISQYRKNGMIEKSASIYHQFIKVGETKASVGG